MTNHSDKNFPNFEVLQKLKDHTLNEPFLGATGEFPAGKLTKTDEGAIQFAVGHENGKVVMDFGTPVHWVGMPPQQAVELAQSLLDHARQCSDDVLTLTIGGKKRMSAIEGS